MLDSGKILRANRKFDWTIINCWWWWLKNGWESWTRCWMKDVRKFLLENLYIYWLVRRTETNDCNCWVCKICGQQTLFNCRQMCNMWTPPPPPTQQDVGYIGVFTVIINRGVFQRELSPDGTRGTATSTIYILYQPWSLSDQINIIKDFPDHRKDPIGFFRRMHAIQTTYNTTAADLGQLVTATGTDILGIWRGDGIS